MAIESVEPTSETAANNEIVALMLNKEPAREEFTFYLQSGGEKREIECIMEALSMSDYDKLQAKYPPTDEEKAQGTIYELKKFAPALIAKSLIQPHFTEAQAKELWTSKVWSRGDVEGLFTRAVRLNHRDSTIPFTGRG